jgi:hypothetical protein
VQRFGRFSIDSQMCPANVYEEWLAFGLTQYTDKGAWRQAQFCEPLCMASVGSIRLDLNFPSFAHFSERQDRALHIYLLI